MVNDWLVWKPSNGFQVKVGEDAMVGSADFYKLSDNLLNCFHDKGIYFLAQISRLTTVDNLIKSWKFCYRFGDTR